MMMCRSFKIAAVVAAVLFIFTGKPATAQNKTNPAGDAVSSVAAAFDQIKPHLLKPAGAVAAVKGNTVYIAREAGHAETGMTLSIVREKEVILHPVTHEKLGSIYEQAGTVTVQFSDDKLITGVLASAGSVIKPGDRIEEAAVAKPKIALAQFVAITSGDGASFQQSLATRLETWDGAAWIPTAMVDRLVYDENIKDAKSASSPAFRKSARDNLQADYLLVYGVTESSGALLTDVALYDLAGARKPVYSKAMTQIPSAFAVAQSPTQPAGAVEPTQKITIPVEGAAASQPPVVKETVKQEPVAPQTKDKPATAKAADTGEKAKALARFDRRIAALLVHDLDGDGSDEIIIGFDTSVGIYKRKGDQLEKVWGKEISPRSQIVGLCAGDFNGNGKPELYINNFVGKYASSMILERSGDAYTTIKDNARWFFIAGADGKLYGQTQATDGTPLDKLFYLTWKDNGFSDSVFINAPKGIKLSGTGIFDLDSDGVMDVVGVDYQHNLAVYSSTLKDWVKIEGPFGGSNVIINIDSTEMGDTNYEFQPQILPLPSGKNYKNLFVAKNVSMMPLLSMKFTKSQFMILEYDGASYAKKTESQQTPNVINAAAAMGKSTPYQALIGRTEEGINSSKSELVLINLDRY